MNEISGKYTKIVEVICCPFCGSIDIRIERTRDASRCYRCREPNCMQPFTVPKKIGTKRARLA